MAQFDFTVTGDPAAAKQATAAALEGDGYRIEWLDDWHATVERGSKGKSAMLGAFAKPYLKLDLRVSSVANAQSLVTLEQDSKGYLGGAVGVQKTKKAFAALRDVVEGALRAQGSFVSVTQTD